jgi:UDPglucose 6-dehydrogenase
MRVCVAGLWHLGTVTAACMAAAGHDVIGYDSDSHRVELLVAGIPPVQEPGLEALVQEGLASGRLSFTSDHHLATRGARVLWVTYDTPVDSSDRGDSAAVVAAVSALLPDLALGSLVLISAQVPVGTTRQLEEAFRSAWPERTVQFAYSPENLRLGAAIDSFMRPERIVVGLNDPDSRATVSALLEPLDTQIEWMATEAAEMTKHALNAFLAASIVFTNEIATVCESVGADVADVVRALRGDPRIGPRAYLGVGTGYAGGTLGRDVAYLTDLVYAHQIHAPLLASIGPSNRHQQEWVRTTLVSLLGELGGKQIAIWGLTYKPDTDTLRRSAAIELCEWLLTKDAIPVAHDPAVRTLPTALASRVSLVRDPLSSIRHADALVVMTAWPEYRSVPIDSLLAEMRHPVVVDPGRLLGDTVGMDARVRYATVGMARA